MSRSAADATRFTATSPYAYSKLSASSSTDPRWPGSKIRSSQGSQFAPEGGHQETAKQKVERLRAQARAARIAQSSSPLDNFIARGRVWANRAHKVAVFSVLAASGVAGILTIYSLSSLIIYNRRQRALWIDRELQRLLEAKQAYISGTATEEQLELLSKEKTGEEEKRGKEELKKQSLFYRGREWLFGGLKEETSETDNERPGVLKAVNAQRLDSAITPEEPAPQHGSPNQFEKTADAASSKSRSWKRW